MVVGSENADQLIAASQSSSQSDLQQAAIQTCFSTMMRQAKTVIHEQLKKLVDRVKAAGKLII